MVQPAVIGAGAGSAKARPQQIPASSVAGSSVFRPHMLSRSSGSFHAGDVFPSFTRQASGPGTAAMEARRPATADSAAAPLAPTASPMRRSSSTKYHTFPSPTDAALQAKQANTLQQSSTPISRRQNRRRRIQRQLHGDSSSDDGLPRRSRAKRVVATPLPFKQLGLLALLSLAEQTALNSISPYLPTMVESFSEIPEGEMGLYVGLLASTFALAQLATNLFWGYLSDAIGRKPVVLLGSFLLMLCFCLFGLCTKYWHVVVIHVAMGLLNGNAAVVPTCLGEVTDRTNQSSAFTWLPVMYSVGSITGPALGGLLVGPRFNGYKYPFLAPNLCSAFLLGVSVVVLGLWFDETLESCDRRALPPSLVWIDDFWKWCCGCMPASASSSTEITPTTSPDSTPSEISPLIAPTDRSADNSNESGNDAEHTTDSTKPSPTMTIVQQLLNQKTVTLLATYLVFQLSNISFNSLYPIFSSAPPPTGRDMPPGQIGLLLSFAGFATILFQVTIFQPLKSKLGNLGSYRGALFGLALSMMLMPWVAHKSENPWWLYSEVAAVLVIKNICAIGGLSSVMLLINNSAPSHETLGTLNGIAQTLSAAGRSIGPFMSGALFSLSTKIHGKGELLAWWIFGGVAAAGWLLSLIINGRGLESADWGGDGYDHDTSDSDGSGDDTDAHDSDETDATAA